ncbi:MAG TPA: hypothetical protein VF263_19125 [Longimicrobiaceae bacterium]
MQKKPIATVLLLAALAGAAGCGGDSTKGDTDDNVGAANANPSEARDEGPDSARVDISPEVEVAETQPSTAQPQ